MSQTVLADLTGYTDRSSIAKIEAGEVDLTLQKILTFAKALRVSPGDLMGDVLEYKKNDDRLIVHRSDEVPTDEKSLSLAADIDEAV